jgi:uncharacterized SAM-binding protein YcdF (DUF218 family)
MFEVIFVIIFVIIFILTLIGIPGLVVFFQEKNEKETEKLNRKQNFIIVPEGKVSCLNCYHSYFKQADVKCSYNDLERDKYTGKIIKYPTGTEKNKNGECKVYTEKDWRKQRYGFDY